MLLNVPGGNATTTVSPSPGARFDWAKVAVRPWVDPVSQASWLPCGPAKQPTRWISAGPDTVAVACAIGTVHSVPTAFQNSS